MKVAVCYPQDFSIPSMPFGTLPLFNACLRKANHEVLLVDIAALTFNALIQPEQVERYLQELDDAYENARAEGQSPDANLARGLERLRAIPRELLLDAGAAAKRQRAPKGFYDPNQMLRDQETLLSVVQLFEIVRPQFDPRNENFAENFYTWLELDDSSDPWVMCYENLIRPQFDQFGPELLALTVPFGMQLADAMRFARWAKRHYPSLKVVLGGTGISDGEEAVHDPQFFQYVDYVVTGDGEDALVELAAALESGGDVSEISSIYYLEGGEVMTPKNRRMVDMSCTPTPNYDGIDWSLYINPERIASLATSRGCYYGKCTFCPESFRVNFRRRNSEEAWRDIQKLATEQGIDNFMFWDPLTPPAALTEISVRAREENLKINWMAQVKFDEAYEDQEYVETLKQGGCQVLQFGFESGVQRVLDDMGKGNELSRVERIVNRLEEVGIGVSVTFFIGFPTELEEDARETWEFLTRFRDKIQYAAYIGPFGLYKDLEVYRNPEHYGIEIASQSDGVLSYTRQDGKNWDHSYLDESYRSRNDLNIIESGAMLLYHKNRKDLVGAIASRQICGPPTFVRPVLGGVELRPIGSNGTSVWQGAGEREYFAYVGASHRILTISLLEHRMIALVEERGVLTTDELLRLAGHGNQADQLVALRRLIDHCLVSSTPLAQDELLGGWIASPSSLGEH